MGRDGEDRPDHGVLGPDLQRGVAPQGLREQALLHRHPLLPDQLRPRQVQARPRRPPLEGRRARRQVLPVEENPRPARHRRRHWKVLPRLQGRAKDVANHLWDNYLGGKSHSRPFGDAVLDGIDFDIELGSKAYYDDLARDLKAYSNRKGEKKVLITAAPQCPFPDKRLGEALRTGLFDRVHVQFYNNPVCSYRAGNVAAFKAAWEDWTKGLPKSSVCLGLPAEREASNKGSGYVDPDTLVSKVLPIVHRSKNYGGIVLWSRYFDMKSGYSRHVKSAV
ncbi:Hevamine-A [Triticum urartu]|uniref:chitinase n=1 Tax=Triticum urartu TaxID=4572 RepID=M7ZGJ6_TRIUA|nr:Hevamine-A [Triticum urartu]